MGGEDNSYSPDVVLVEESSELNEDFPDSFVSVKAGIMGSARSRSYSIIGALLVHIPRPVPGVELVPVAMLTVAPALFK
jgi:hypothetical protein